MSCKIPTLETKDPVERYALARAQMGGQNCNLDVVFSDGVVWIARIRLSNTPRLPPQPVQNYIQRSEAATMVFLTTTDIPAPQIFKYEAMPNRVGVAYSLIEKLEGNPLNAGWPPSLNATKEQCTRLIAQLADLYIELSRFKFDQTGSLIPAGDEKHVTIEGFAEEQYFEHFDTPSLGPFHSAVSAMKAMSSQSLRMIASGELPDLPVDNYLRHLWRLEILSEKHDFLPIADNEAGYFLRHRDDKGDHVLVDSDFNITGVLDWEFASVQHASLAFCSPSMMWPIGDFYDGNDKLADAEIELAQTLEKKGHPKLAQYVLRGRLMQRLDFEFLLYPAVEAEFILLFQAARRAYILAATGVDSVSPYAEWKEMMLAKYADDEGLKAVHALASGVGSEVGKSGATS